MIPPTDEVSPDVTLDLTPDDSETDVVEKAMVFSPWSTLYALEVAHRFNSRVFPKKQLFY